MENIKEYKENFATSRISDKEYRTSAKLMSEEYQNKKIADIIGDIDISMENAIQGIFDKIERPVVVVCDDNIEYVNNAFLKLLGFSSNSKILHERFLKFVSQDDWNFIAENIGDILMENGLLELRMLNANYKVIKTSFDTLYLEDKQHFCFVLIGRPVEIRPSVGALMYDEQIGLPKFYLYEYRVQSAIDYENYKSAALKRNKVVICGVAIRNFTALKNEGKSGLIMQRLAEKLLLGLNKLYTVATGSKYQFWILMPDMQSDVEIEQELNNIHNMLAQPVAGNGMHYDISIAMGVSVYPDTAQSAKKLINQAEMAIRQALKDSHNPIVYFGA